MTDQAPDLGPDGVHDALRARILRHDLAAGARISIAHEASRLGVSQTPVREALHRLEGDRLVVRSPSRGYEVTPLIDHDGLVALFETRLLIEPWAAREAASHRLTNPADVLRRELERLSALHGPGRPLQAERADGDHRFHRAVLEATGNALLPRVFEQLHTHVHIFRLYQPDADGSTALAEHEAITGAIEACDPDAAEEAMRDHLVSSFRRLSETFGPAGGPATAGGAGAGGAAPAAGPAGAAGAAGGPAAAGGAGGAAAGGAAATEPRAPRTRVL